MRRSRGLLALVALAGCTADVGPVSEWTPVAEVGGPLAPEWGAPPSPLAARATGLPLRVVTWNVYKGADVDGIVEAILGDPELASAEVLLLQEIEAHPGEGGSRAARVAAGLGMGFVYAPSRLADRGTHGLAILSSLPLLDARVMRLPDVALPVSDAARIAVAATVVVDGQPLRIIDVHLDTRLNVPERILQLRPAALDAPDPVILGGDLNTNAYVWTEGAVPSLPVEAVAAPDHQARALDDYLRDIGYLTPTAGFGATQTTPVLDSRLDAIVMRGLTATTSPATGGVRRNIGLSDHWPVWVDVAMP